jgi:hypothetical protein
MVGAIHLKDKAIHLKDKDILLKDTDMFSNLSGFLRKLAITQQSWYK